MTERTSISSWLAPSPSIRPERKSSWASPLMTFLISIGFELTWGLKRVGGKGARRKRRKAPNSKLQAPEKHQTPISKIVSYVGRERPSTTSLELGAWCLV